MLISDHPEKKKDLETPKKEPSPQLEPVGSPTSYKKQHQTAVQRLASLNSISSNSSRKHSNNSESKTTSSPNKKILQNSSVNSANYLFNEKNEKQTLDESPENVQNSSTYGNFNNFFEEGQDKNPEISKSSWNALPSSQPTVEENITIGSNLSLFDKTQSKPDWATAPQMNGQPRNFQNRNFQQQNVSYLDFIHSNFDDLFFRTNKIPAVIKTKISGPRTEIFNTRNSILINQTFKVLVAMRNIIKPTTVKSLAPIKKDRKVVIFL